MKVFALAILLVSICCLEGALVKRQAEEGQGQAQVPAFEETFQQFTQKLNEYISPERLSTLRTQAQTHFQQFHDSLTAASGQLSDSLTQFLHGLADLSKQPAE